MTWQVFVRVGINNTSAKADNTTNKDAVAATNSIRDALQAAKFTKKAQRKTATYRATVSSKDDIDAVVAALKSVLEEIGGLENSGKRQRLASDQPR